jgi:predicted nucleic acid-binding protein
LAYEYLPTNDEHWQAALDAQRRLASVGRHRAVGMVDLLIAALATMTAVSRLQPR